MLTNSIGKTMRIVCSMRSVGMVGRRMGMATTIDVRTLSPDPPKPGKPKVKGWDRATFTIKVLFVNHILGRIVNFE